MVKFLEQCNVMAFIKHTFTPASLTTQSLWLCGSKSKLWKIPKEMEIIDHLTCLLRNLYANQEATVRTLHGTTDSFQIGRELWQGCVLSPCLFNFYVEYIMWHAKLDEAQAGNQDRQEKCQQSQICRWYHSNGRKWRTEKPLDQGEIKIMACGPITS